jgi:hypothetical protein
MDGEFARHEEVDVALADKLRKAAKREVEVLPDHTPLHDWLAEQVTELAERHSGPRIGGCERDGLTRAGDRNERWPAGSERSKAGSVSVTIKTRRHLSGIRYAVTVMLADGEASPAIGDTFHLADMSVVRVVAVRDDSPRQA